jgi:hypothetical protein
MPKRRYERREPTYDWGKLRPLLKDPAQLQYEIIRPVILFGQTPTERAAETGMPRSTIYYRANLFDQAGMASLFPAVPPLPVTEQKKLDQRTLPHTLFGIPPCGRIAVIENLFSEPGRGRATVRCHQMTERESENDT